MTKQIAFLIMSLVAGVAPSSAQMSSGKLPVAIVLVSELPFNNAKAVLIRRKEMRPENIVLVTKATSPTDLIRAMAALTNSRRNKGDHVTDDIVAPIPATASAQRSKDYPQAVKDLSELRTAPARFIEGVGSAKVIFSHIRPLKNSTTK